MTISLEAQGQAFLLTLGMGALLGLYYDLLRLPRLLLPPRWAQELLDLLFWLGAFFLLFLCATWLEGGRVRLYLALALLCGSLAYFFLLSPAVRHLLSRFAALVARLLGFLLSPLRRLGAVLTAQWAKFIRPRLENWKKSFSFSQRWSTMSQFHCLHRRVSRRKKGGLILRLLLLVLLAYMVIMLVRVRGQITTASNDLDQLTAQVSQQLQTNTELSNAIENRDDPNYLKDIARERLGLVSQDDWVFYIAD